MTESQDYLPGRATYLNPVYDRSCPDPFVLKFGGEYWAYCTGLWHDGRVFGVLRSRDLVHWEELAGAMETLPEGTLSVPLTCYWAPEVVYENGRFLMYYSLGNEARMEIRVAVAAHPAGPFVDSGRSLTKEEFAIDAHVFVDTDGTRHLFYATDFLTHTHVGTGIVRDRMLDSFTLAGEPRPVTRARFDWQVYDPQRKEKGGVRWHTVEGPSVLKHKNRYYEMFSGGNWQNTTYGVSFATTDDIEAEGEWEQSADGERVLPILRTIPGKVAGPGHNSVVRGPDNRQLFCVYHLWTDNGRVLAIDRLDWAGERMLVLGPTTTPQPAPIAPAFEDLFDDERAGGLGENWKCVGGRWTARGGECVQADAQGDAEAVCRQAATAFVVEVYARALASTTGGGRFGLRLRDACGAVLLEIYFEPEANRIVFAEASKNGARRKAHALPENFDSEVFHLARLEVDESRVSFVLDDWTARTETELNAAVAQVSLFTHESAAAFKGFSLTIGWEDLFATSGRELRSSGRQAAAGDWNIREGRLRYTPSEGGRGILTKGPLLESYEMVVNASLDEEASEGKAGYGFYPACDDEDAGPLLVLERAGAGWALRRRDGSETREFPLPASFDPFIEQHFRFVKHKGRLFIGWENEPLGVLETANRATRVGFYGGGVKISFDLIRVTMLK